MSQDKQARRDSRLLAVQVLFAYLERKETVSFKKTLSFVLKDINEQKKDTFAQELLELALENLGKIKVIIKAFAPEFAWEKIAPINRVILILGIAEMKFLGTPPVVVINEYIEVAKEFGEERSSAFVNGVLDAYRKSLGLKQNISKKEKT